MSYVVKTESIANWGDWIEEKTDYQLFENLGDALNKLHDEIEHAKTFKTIGFRISIRIDSTWSTPYESKHLGDVLSERYELLSKGLEV